MPIQVTCPDCNRRLRVADKNAGKRIKCPQCQSILRVPEAAPDGGVADAWYLKTGDAAEYGPATRQELDTWFQEGRITEDCQLLHSGDDQWQWASDVYPQLVAQPAPAPGSVPPAAPSSPPGIPPSPGGGLPLVTGDAATTQRSASSDQLQFRAAQRRKVRGPATFLLVVASLAILLCLANLTMNFIRVNREQFTEGERRVAAWFDMKPADMAMLNSVIGVVAIGLYGYAVFGALSMKNLRGYGHALMSSIIMMLPCSGCCLLGLPAGIWAIIVLSNPDVKAAFRQTQSSLRRF